MFKNLNWIMSINNKFKLITLLILLINLPAFSQESGKITGNVVDSDLGEGLIGVNVILEGTTYGAATDINGRYSIGSVPQGTYNIIFSMIGYTRQTVTGVVVKSGQTAVIDVSLQLESYETDEVIITAKAAEDSEAGLLIKRQKSVSVSDAISAEQISRTGAGDAADAVKQVVGASIVDGKYVYVRGLGDRYSSTQLNGAELPSSDPNKKAFQLDLLPTNLLDNIVTIKTFTPDKPGNFSGGIVDVGTKSFPDRLTIKLKGSYGYNSQVTFNNNYLTYSGGSKDWLGFDDGTRDIPELLRDPSVKIPNSVEARFDPGKAQLLDDYSKSFNNIMDVKSESAPVEQKYGLSIGNEIKLGDESSLGYLGSLTYSRDYSYYEDGQVGIYRLNQGATELNPQVLLKDNQGTSETGIGALGALTYNITSQHQIGGNIFYSRSGISTARSQRGFWPQELGDQTRIVNNRVLGYTERDILSYQLRGDHFLSFINGTQVDWMASISSTKQNEPDLRLTFFIEDTTRDPIFYTIRGSNFDDPSRYYRVLNDKSNSFNLNFAIPFTQWSGLNSKFKFGGMYQDSHRDFNERIFSYLPDNVKFNDVGGNLGDFFDSQNVGRVNFDSATGRSTFSTVIEDGSRQRNNYTGDQIVRAVYGMFDLPVTKQLRFIGGLRYETTDLEVISADATQDIGKINEQDWLPSVNFIYQLNDRMNIRLAATQTLARPNFREIAPYSSKEFINGVELQGNPELKRTLIENYDLRWEWFSRPGEIIALSGFYKKLKNPIERSFAQGTTEANRIITYTNVDEAIIIGGEFEARLRLDLLSDALSNFTLGGNLSIIHSSIDIPASELEARLSIDSTSSTTRELQGQSPVIVNVDLAYFSPATGTTVSLYFNVFAERLSKVSTNLTPDVYEQPAPQLDLNISQVVIPNMSIKFAVKNLLNAEYKEVYRYKGDDYIYYSYRRGIEYALGFDFNL